MQSLAAAVDGWNPAPVTVTARLDDEPVKAFAALLDQPSPVGVGADPLPLGWHWFFFLDRPASSALGPDGHPVEGHFLPPVPDRCRMFAGGRLRVFAPLNVGDLITRVTSLAAVEPKQGRSGEMLFVTLRSEFRRDGELLLVEEQDIVYRSEPAGRPARPLPAMPPADRMFLPPAAEDEMSADLLPDTRMLFRFSALTYNAHRIHYDQPYATGVEGYPGLVVHGPLLALLLLEVPRRHLPGRRVASFSYRLTRPAFAGVSVRATGRANGAEVRLSAAAGTSAPSISGTAVLDPVTKGAGEAAQQ